MLELHDIPGTHIAQAVIPAHGSADATTGHPIFRAPFDCTLTAVRIIAGADVTGQGTNYFNLNLINRGTSGTATTELANRDYSGTAVTETRGVPRTLYSTATNLSAGTILEIEREKVGTGLASPAFLVEIEYEGR